MLAHTLKSNLSTTNLIHTQIQDNFFFIFVLMKIPAATSENKTFRYKTVYQKFNFSFNTYFQTNAKNARKSLRSKFHNSQQFSSTILFDIWVRCKSLFQIQQLFRRVNTPYFHHTR